MRVKAFLQYLRDRSILARIRDRTIRRAFRFWEMLGIHVTPIDYYQPIPNTRVLSKQLREGRLEMPAVEMNSSGQLTTMDALMKFQAEYDALPITSTEGFNLSNQMFSWVDAQVYYAMIRWLRPARIVEVGAGHSTVLAGLALQANARHDSSYACALVAVEPHPQLILSAVDWPDFTAISLPVQEAPRQTFDALAANDILFIDTSHVVRMGGDVPFLILDVIPRLSPGVVVHLHDIFLPYEYPRTHLAELRFYSEQYLLQAFLAFNGAFEVLWSGRYLWAEHREALRRAFPLSEQHGRTGATASFWMRRRVS